MKKRVLSIFLIVCLCAALLPTAALAAGETLPTVTGSHDADGYKATVGEATDISTIDSSAGYYHLQKPYVSVFSLQYKDKNGKAPTEATTLTISGVERSELKNGKPAYVIVCAPDSFGSPTDVYCAEFDENGDLRFTMDGRDSKNFLSGCNIAITQSKYSSELAVSLKLPQQLQKSDTDTYQFQYTVDFTVDQADNLNETYSVEGGFEWEIWYANTLNLNVNEGFIPGGNPWSGESLTGKKTLDITATLDAAARSTGKLSAYAELTLDTHSYSHQREKPLFISPTLYSDVSLVKFVDSDAADAEVLDVYLAATGSPFDKPITEPKRDEYDFAGWYYKDADGAEHPFNGTIAVAGEMIIYAKWAEPFGGAAGLVAILDDIPFVDVSFNDYYYDSVKWAYHSGVTGGTDAWHFSPDAGCTRAQAVTFLWRAAGCPTAGYLGNFTDVDADAYYAPAVAWAVANGVTNGTSATTFSPEAACSRGDIVTFLYRAFGGTSNGYHPFSDVPANAYYADAVAWAYEHGVTGGTSADKFSPADACSRAQIVTFLYRVLG